MNDSAADARKHAADERDRIADDESLRGPKDRADSAQILDERDRQAQKRDRAADLRDTAGHCAMRSRDC